MPKSSNRMKPTAIIGRELMLSVNQSATNAADTEVNMRAEADKYRQQVGIDRHTNAELKEGIKSIRFYQNGAIRNADGIRHYLEHGTAAPFLSGKTAQLVHSKSTNVGAFQAELTKLTVSYRKNEAAIMAMQDVLDARKAGTIKRFTRTNPTGRP